MYVVSSPIRTPYRTTVGAMQQMVTYYRRAVLENYANFSGRDTRAQFWWFALANLIISVVASIVATSIGVPLLSNLYSLAVLVPGVAAAIRRLHDVDKSGWWLLLVLVPIVGLIVVIVFLATDTTAGSNQYGSATSAPHDEPGYPPVGGTPPPPPPPPGGTPPPPPPPPN